jgi:hypothetical protein
MARSAATTKLSQVEQSIIFLRGHRVLLDSTLAALYGVPTKVLVQSVKRNRERFPPDFMFVLNNHEVVSLRSQIVTSSWGGRRYLPFAFTEQGVAMLSSVLNSPRAVRANIEIMRTFVRLGVILAIEAPSSTVERSLDSRQSVRDLIAIRGGHPVQPRPTRRIGFITDE